MNNVYSFRAPTNRTVYFDGMKHGLPIALGYFVVAFSLGVAARNAGLTAFQGGLASLLCSASAGEYAGFTTVAEDASYMTIILASLIANARYLLMSCAIGQKASSDLSFFHRCLVAFGLTDEVFGISIVRPGALNPWFHYGAMTLTIPFWTVGSVLGVVAGNVLSVSLVSALSVTLFGMFIAIVVPPCRTNRVLLALVPASFLLSYIASIVPGLAGLSEGLRTVILTVVLAAIAAALFPVKEEETPAPPAPDADASASDDPLSAEKKEALQ